MWTKHTVVVTRPRGAPPVTRAGHTLSILKKQNGKWVLARECWPRRNRANDTRCGCHRRQGDGRHDADKLGLNTFFLKKPSSFCQREWNELRREVGKPDPDSVQRTDRGLDKEKKE
jgi:hypothetical protein